MKSFFTKLSKVLLCGVAVAVVGCTDYDTDIQNVNERVDAVEADLEQALADLGSKVQANTAAISALEATLNSKIAEEVKNLNAAIDKKADKATVEEQFNTLYATLAEAQAALEAAINTNANAIQGAVARIDALEAAGKQLQAAVAKNAEDITALQTELAAQVEALYAYVDTAVEEIYGAIQVVQEFASAINTLLQEEVARLDVEDAAIWAEIETIEEVCTNLANLIALEAEERQAADDLIYQEIETLRASIASVYTTLDEKIDTEVAELNKTIAELTQTVATLYTYITELQVALEAHAAALESLGEEIDLLNRAIETVNQTISAVINAHNDDMAAVQDAIEGLNANIETTQEALTVINRLVSGLSADVEAVLARVQSLVYVPEYSDHKAVIDFALLTGDMPFSLPTIIAKASDLKYLVKADDAATVAAAIAANPSSLSYVVETVETRAAAQPALEVVGVKAEGEYIIVSAVAKNFAREFFEAEEAEGIYSAALVLSGENDTRTTEFTNLIPSTEPAEFKLAMVLPVEDAEVASEAGYRLAEATINYLMPCNDTENTESAVKPIAAFIPAVDGEPVLTAPLMFYTEELLQEEGYDVNVEKKALITLATSTHERIFDPTADLNKCEGIETKKADFFNITEAPKWDYHYTVQEGVDFVNVGEKSTVAYVYTCGEAQDVLTYEFELANAQVYLTIEKNIPWTFNYVQKYIEGKATYTFAGIADADNVTIEGTDAILDLASVLKQGGKTTKYYTKDYSGWIATSKDNNPIREQHSDKDSDVVFALQRGAYTFNNSYKAVITTTTANVDYNTTIIVNLVGYQPSITVPVTVDLKLDGKNPEFVAPVDLAAAAYSHLTAEYDYLGYGADNSANWTALFGYYKDAYAAEALAYPVVNANNEYKNFDALKGLAQVRIPLDQLKKDTKTNTVTWSIWPVSGFQINYVITGDVVTPKGNLLYADSYVENATAVAKGQLEGGVYSIIKSHLPYYFNVDQVDGHDYTVKFTVEAPNSTATNNVTLDNDVVAVLAQDGTYYPLEDNATLDWATYTGLQVNVTATLYANGYPIDFKPLAIVTYDPLTFTVANVEVEREMRKPLQVQLFKEAVLTSAVEEVENLIKFANEDETLTTTEQAFAYAKSAYGAEVSFVITDPQAKSHVYYYDNTGKKVYLPKTQYSYANGILTINGDDSVAKTYYADFTAIMKSRICVGEHRQEFRIIMKGTK